MPLVPVSDTALKLSIALRWARGHGMRADCPEDCGTTGAAARCRGSAARRPLPLSCRSRLETSGRRDFRQRRVFSPGPGTAERWHIAARLPKEDNRGGADMPVLQAAGGHLVLGRYRGPEIPRREWEDLTYTTYATDPGTFFAPITSATGKTELKGFWEYGKADLEGVWTANAKKCPALVSWIESIGARFGRAQLLRMTPNTLRECRWGLHLDNNRATRSPTAGSCECGWS